MSASIVTQHSCRPFISALTLVAFLAAQLTPLSSAIARDHNRQAGVATNWLRLAQLRPATTSVAPTNSISRSEYEACQARDEAGFKAAVETITRRALRQGMAGMDYAAAVDGAWRSRKLSNIINTQVDLAIKGVREETSWGKLMKSLASKETAKKLATTVATRVYRAEPVKQAIELLAADVGAGVGKRMELATIDAAGPARKCMQAFLGKRFGQTVARVVSGDASNKLEIASDEAGSTVSTGSVILANKGGLAGAMVLIMRRQLAKIATRIGQRVVGVVLSRLVSVIAGGVGLVLIAKDIWDMRHGVLPIISDEMKSPDTMAKVREELAKAIKDQMNANIDDLGSQSAEQVVKIWRDFRQAHSKILDLAERNSSFKQFLNNVPAGQLAQLDEVVALTLAVEGELGVLRRLADGTLDESVKLFSPQLMQVARDTRNIAMAFQWRELAGDDLGKVISYDVHRRSTPDQFTRRGLARIFQLNDTLAISRLVGIDLTTRQPLFELASQDLKSLARSLTQDQLTQLSGYLTGLEKSASQRLLFAIAANPAKMRVLAKSSVRDALIASNDQLAAVRMMVRSNRTFDLTTFMQDVSLVRQARVSPWLLWQRYPGALTALAVLALLFLIIMWRMLFGRRARVPVPQPTPLAGTGAAPPPTGPGA